MAPPPTAYMHCTCTSTAHAWTHLRMQQQHACTSACRQAGTQRMQHETRATHTTHAHMHHACTCIYTCTHMHTRAHACMHACMHECTQMHAQTRMHRYMHKHRCTNTHPHIVCEKLWVFFLCRPTDRPTDRRDRRPSRARALGANDSRDGGETDAFFPVSSSPPTPSIVIACVANDGVAKLPLSRAAIARVDYSLRPSEATPPARAELSCKVQLTSGCFSTQLGTTAA